MSELCNFGKRLNCAQPKIRNATHKTRNANTKHKRRNANTKYGTRDSKHQTQDTKHKIEKQTTQDAKCKIRNTTRAQLLFIQCRGLAFFSEPRWPPVGSIKNITGPSATLRKRPDICVKSLHQAINANAMLFPEPRNSSVASTGTGELVPESGKFVPEPGDSSPNKETSSLNQGNSYQFLKPRC